MPDTDLDPVRFAGLVAPAIDRAFRSAIDAPRHRGGRELVQAYGGAEAIGLMIDLRNVLSAGRPIGPELIAISPYQYRDPDDVPRALARSASAGLLDSAGDDRYVASERGRSFLLDLTEQHASVLGDRWASHGERVDRLTRLVGRVLRAAEESGGPGWAVYSPVHEPADTPVSVLLLNRLQLLRHHRADAHTKAWRTAGLTAHEIVALPAGPRRDAIEHDTNVRAAAPYAELGPSDRLQLLADLAGIP